MRLPAIKRVWDGIRRAAAVLSALIVCVRMAPAQHPNIVIDPPATSASEVTIALDPTNPDNLIAGANLMFAYHSTDGGHTWNIGTLASQYGVWGDPCVIFDERGGAYYAHLSNPPGGRWIDRIVVQTSSDGGATWPGDVGVGFHGATQQQDKHWLACDLSRSAHRGTMYMSWTEFDKYASTIPTDSSRIRFSRSTDHGASWSEPIVISRLSGDCIDSDTTDEGAVPAADTNGNVHVVWADRRGIVFASSTDAGVTFGNDRVLAGTVEGWDFPVSGLQRGNGLPVIVTDFSGGPHRGTMYIIWTDRLSRSSSGLQVLMMISTDDGATWSAPRKVNADNGGRDHIFPAISVDQSTGAVYVVYYDRRATTGDDTEVWVSYSKDGGATFTDVRVSDAPFTPTPFSFIGDYIGIAAGNGRAYPIWTRMDTSVKSVLTAILRDSSGSIVIDRVTSLPLATTLAQNFPNPFNAHSGSTTITFTLAQDDARGTTTLAVYDLAGRQVKALMNDRLAPGEHQVELHAGVLPQGTYLYRLSTAARVVERTLVVQ